MASSRPAESGGNVGKKYQFGDLKQGEIEFLVECVLNTNTDGAVDMTQVSSVIGNTNVASTRNRFMALKKKYNIGLNCKTGSGKPELATHTSRDVSDTPIKASTNFSGAKRGRKRANTITATEVDSIKDDPWKKEHNEHKWTSINKPATKKRRNKPTVAEDSEYAS